VLKETDRQTYGHEDIESAVDAYQTHIYSMGSAINSSAIKHIFFRTGFTYIYRYLNCSRKKRVYVFVKCESLDFFTIIF